MMSKYRYKQVQTVGIYLKAYVCSNFKQTVFTKCTGRFLCSRNSKAAVRNSAEMDGNPVQPLELRSQD